MARTLPPTTTTFKPADAGPTDTQGNPATNTPAETIESIEMVPPPVQTPPAADVSEPAPPETLPVATALEIHPAVGVAASAADTPKRVAPPTPEELVDRILSLTAGTVYLRSAVTGPSGSTMYDPQSKLYYFSNKATPTKAPVSGWMGLQLRALMIVPCEPDFEGASADPSQFNRTAEPEEVEETDDLPDDDDN